MLFRGGGHRPVLEAVFISIVVLLKAPVTAQDRAMSPNKDRLDLSSGAHWQF